MNTSDIDRIVAERVMGLPASIAEVRVFHWHPSSNIAHAWMVVERMQEMGWTWSLVSPHHYRDVIPAPEDSQYGATFKRFRDDGGRVIYLAVADTPMRAICLAALRCVDGERTEKDV